MNKYDKLIQALNLNGYNVKLDIICFKELDSYKNYYFEKDNVVGMISTDSNNKCIGIWDNALVIDSKWEFNKWSQAIIQLDIKDNDKFISDVVKELEFLNTPTGQSLCYTDEYSLRYTKDYYLWEGEQ